MSTNVTQQYNEVKAKFEAGQKMLAALQAEQAKQENELTRINILKQIQEKGVARDASAWYVDGNTLKVRN